MKSSSEDETPDTNELPSSSASNQKTTQSKLSPDNQNKRQINLGDSGISCERSENSSDDDLNKKPKVTNKTEFHKASKAKNRSYRKKVSELVEDKDSDVFCDESNSSKDLDMESESTKSAISDGSETLGGTRITSDNESDGDKNKPNDRKRRRSSHRLRYVDSDDDSDTDIDKKLKDDVIPEVLSKSMPKHKWFPTQEVIKR